MPYFPEGPREWRPGMREDIIEGRKRGERFELRFHKEVRKVDLRNLFFDFFINAELALDYKDPVELYWVSSIKGRKVKSIGELIWFPNQKRGGVITWKDWQAGGAHAEWTRAESEEEVLGRWVWGEMTGKE